jgi:DNA-directed RNA polymerase specialized sigma24 family protein
MEAPHDQQPLSDAELVQRAQAGDSQAFEVLLRRHLPVFRRHAERVCGNPTDAQDVCQDAICKAVSNLCSLRNAAVFCAWVRGIITNEANNRRRNLKIVGTSLEELTSNQVESMSIEPSNCWPADFEYLRGLLRHQANHVEQPYRRTALFMLDYFGKEQEFPPVRTIAEATDTSHGTAQRCRDIILVVWRRTLTAFNIQP